MVARAERRKFKSGHKLTPRAMVEQIKPLVADWEFDAISIGFPSPVRNGSIIEDYLGKIGQTRLGEKTWQRDVQHALVQLKKSLIADYVVLGGGNAKKLNKIPRGIELGHNRNAFLGGVRLWQIDARTRRPKWQVL